jgi:hypothetical protein
LNSTQSVAQGALGRGDLVEVKSASEILGTLDERGTLDALPFMPEMVAHCGRRFTVAYRTEKICDTIQIPRSLRLRDSVILEDLRCDGSGHDGCQAECRLYWKEAWLRRVPAGASQGSPDPDAAGKAALMELTRRHVKESPPADGRRAACYRCQATETLRASEVLRTFDPRPYVREVSSGNVGLGRFARVMARATAYEALRKAKLLPVVPLRGSSSASPRTEPLGLKPGEWVEVRPPEEIRQTLSDKGKNRGLWFDREMVPFCGKTFRVRKRIERLIDERTSQMVELKSDCVTLDGAVCSGERSFGRWFCPRAIFPYWREGWLRRVEAPAGAAPDEERVDAQAADLPRAGGSRTG